MFLTLKQHIIIQRPTFQQLKWKEVLLVEGSCFILLQLLNLIKSTNNEINCKIQFLRSTGHIQALSNHMFWLHNVWCRSRERNPWQVLAKLPRSFQLTGKSKTHVGCHPVAVVSVRLSQTWNLFCPQPVQYWRSVWGLWLAWPRIEAPPKQRSPLSGEA